MLYGNIWVLNLWHTSLGEAHSILQELEQGWQVALMEWQTAMAHNFAFMQNWVELLCVHYLKYAFYGNNIGRNLGEICFLCSKGITSVEIWEKKSLHAYVERKKYISLFVCTSSLSLSMYYYKIYIYIFSYMCQIILTFNISLCLHLFLTFRCWLSGQLGLNFSA